MPGHRFHRLARRRRAAFTAISFILAAGCGGAPSYGETPMAQPQQATVAGAPADDAAGKAPAQAGARPAAPAGQGQPLREKTSGAPASAAPEGAKTSSTGSKDEQRVAQVLIMYTGDVSLTVDADQVAKTIDAVVDAAETVGGHLAGRTNDSVKVKVPSQRFREGLQKIEKLGTLVSESITAEDVTAEFKDAEVRLENLRATRKRLEEFLARAGTMADMLTVERELERVAKEMDVLTGRQRFLKEHTAFSMLTVRLTAKVKPVPVVVQEPPPPPPAPPPPPPRAIDLPVSWFGTLGIDQLLKLPAAKK